MRPSMQLRRPAAMHMPAAAMRVPVAARIVPPIVVAGCVATVVTYISTQLRSERGAMDKIFSQKNDEKYEKRRAEIFTDFEPRRSMYNILGW